MEKENKLTKDADKSADSALLVADGVIEAKKIYRIEKEYRSLWYDEEGRFDSIIEELCPYSIAKNFPMPKNLELHRKDGLVWYSAGKSIENMNEWFAPQDAINLYNDGFKLFKFEVNKYQELPMETLFCREGIVNQEEIPLEEVWEI